ncbi:MAG: RagB/SusD family nutrient uptake outer membrane protein [Muribaculaceae bacterium]|nr:RagB/SusD family nutrient uptake outer membrane protein [Muribaculaceae bacterium]
MKLYNKFLVVTTLLLSMMVTPSCSDDDLDVPLYGGREDKEFYQNLDEINQSLTACYYFLKQAWNEVSLELMFINDIGSDDCDKSCGGATDVIDLHHLETFNINATNSKVSNLWAMSYKSIYQINILLDKAAEFRANNTLSEKDEKLLTRYENEAKWLRGFWYYNLAYFWGDVPLFLHAEKPADIYKSRTPVAKVWEQVIADFTAATNLPKRSEYAPEDMGRATSGAAYAMLGRTYWFVRDFDNSKKVLDEFFTGTQKGEYDLDPDYATQWLNHNSNVKESIFEIQYKSNGKNWNMSTGWNGVWFNPACDSGYGFHLPTQQLLDEFDPEDPRITWTFIKLGDQFKDNSHKISNTVQSLRYFDRKHFIPLSETINSSTPIYPQDVEMTVYIIRYADVLLMYAESCLETGDITNAKINLNKVRKRARNSSALDPKREIQVIIPNTTPNSLPDVVSGDVNEVREAIWHERRCEFGCEGLRRMDLVQQQRYGKVMTDYYNNNNIQKETPDKGRYYSKEKELFPIPQEDIDLSKGVLIQNPGY